MRNDNRRKINEKEPNFSPVVRALIRGTMTWGFKPDLLNSFGFFKWLSKLKLKFLGAGKRTGNRKLKKKKKPKKTVFMVLRPTESTGNYPINREKSISRHSTPQNLGKQVETSSLSQNMQPDSERLPIL